MEEMLDLKKKYFKTACKNSLFMIGIASYS